MARASGQGAVLLGFSILSWEQVCRPCRNARGLGWSRALGSRGMTGLGRQEQGLPAPVSTPRWETCLLGDQVVTGYCSACLPCGFLICEAGTLSWRPGKGMGMSVSQFSRSVVSDSLRPHGLQHARPPCPSPTP